MQRVGERVDVDDLWMAIEDLGPVHSLADLLLGDSAADAEAGMVAWAGALGRLHAGTGDPALHERWRALRGEHGDPPTEESAATELAKLRSALPHLVIDDAVDAAVAEVDERLGDRRWWAMTPRDACPDNCAVRPDGSVVLFDFEGGGARHALLDAAYLVTTFPTCWCTGPLPAAPRRTALQAYREEAGLPDGGYDQHLAAAAGYHALWVLGSYRLREALTAEGAAGIWWDEVGFEIPPTRQMVALAVDDLHGAVAGHPALEPLGTLAEQLRGHLGEIWDGWVQPPAHPAFRSAG
jgi:hypothetical protein